jgi:hypothetical protein
MFLAYPALLTAGERTLVNGIVNASKDTSGNIVAVKLNLSVEGGEVFNIVLDETGKKLSIEMDGEWVEVIGDVYDQGGVMWIEVKSYKKHKENIFE